MVVDTVGVPVQLKVYPAKEDGDPVTSFWFCMPPVEQVVPGLVIVFILKITSVVLEVVITSLSKYSCLVWSIGKNILIISAVVPEGFAAAADAKND